MPLQLAHVRYSLPQVVSPSDGLSIYFPLTKRRQRVKSYLPPTLYIPFAMRCLTSALIGLNCTWNWN